MGQDDFTANPQTVFSLPPLYWGINATNFQAFKDTKVNILVIGTSIDKMVEKAAQNAVTQFMAL